MCEIYDFSEMDAEWKDTVTKEETAAFLNGRKHMISILNSAVNPSHSSVYNHVIQRINSSIPILNAGGSFEASMEIEVQWGGNEKAKSSIGAKMEYKDANGNYANVKISQSESGRCKANASAGQKKEKN